MKSGAQPYVAGLLAAVLLCWLSLWNGYPLVYEDTLTYLERPATVAWSLGGVASDWANPDKSIRLTLPAEPPRTAQTHTDAPAQPAPYRGGRSIYYGIPAYALDLVGGLWAVIAAQAVLISMMVALVWFRCLGLASRGGFVLVVGLLAALTSAGLFTNLVMPDIFAGALVLGLAMLFAYGERLGRGDRWFVGITSLFAIIVHDTHLLVAVMMVVAALVLPLVWRRLRPLRSRRGGRLAVAAVSGGIIASLAFVVFVTAWTGQGPARLPFLTAHLLAKPGFGEYLARECDGARDDWAACAFRDEVPMTWTKFLFDSAPGTGGYASRGPQVRDAISKQEMSLLLSALADSPVAIGGALIADGFEQIGAFSYEDLAPRPKARYIQKNFPDVIIDRVQASQLWADDAPLARMSRVQEAVVVISLPVLALFMVLLLRTRTPEARSFGWFAVLVLIGVVGNGLICGVLASPYDRFQSRVIWLVPLLAMYAVAVWRQQRVLSDDKG